MFGLSGKTCIVTGGTRGIGKGIAKMLLEEGAAGVLITGRKAATGEEAVSELGKISPAIHFICGDMGGAEFCAAVADEALRLFGRVDYLVNNAFPFTAKSFDATRRDWLHSMEAGPIAYATMIAEYVRVHGREVPGAVVNVSSISQYIAQPHRWTYNSAKGAVGQLTKCAAMDLAPYIRVNSISPGCVWTDECGADHESPLFADVHMIGRVIEVDECAGPTLFLLSDYASAITATDLNVDGGMNAVTPRWNMESDYVGSE